MKRLRLRLVLMVVLAAIVAAPVQATSDTQQGIQIDSMDNIFGPWTDLRDGPGQGAGWLKQSAVSIEGTGSMEIDYSKTYNHDGIAPWLLPNPLATHDYLGALLGPGLGTFDAAGNYLGDFDRELRAFVAPGQLPILVPGTHIFALDVFKTVAFGPEHVRELQLYDGLGARNTYSVQPEATASTVGAGWKTYLVNLAQPMENNANLANIQEMRLWATAWSAFVWSPQPLPGSGDCLWPQWPADYTVVRPTGTPLLIDDLRLIPEPATMTMLGLGGLALLRRRKKA